MRLEDLRNEKRRKEEKLYKSLLKTDLQAYLSTAIGNGTTYAQIINTINDPDHPLHTLFSVEKQWAAFTQKMEDEKLTEIDTAYNIFRGRYLNTYFYYL